MTKLIRGNSIWLLWDTLQTLATYFPESQSLSKGINWASILIQPMFTQVIERFSIDDSPLNQTQFFLLQQSSNFQLNIRDFDHLAFNRLADLTQLQLKLCEFRQLVWCGVLRILNWSFLLVYHDEGTRRLESNELTEPSYIVALDESTRKTDNKSLITASVFHLQRKNAIIVWRVSLRPKRKCS